MATLRLHSNFCSLSGKEYILNIFDEEGGSVQAFQTIRNSVKLSYDGENQARNNPIISSRLEIGMVVENAEQEAIIEEIINAQETRFTVNLLEGSTTIWGGYILTDLVEIENLYYPFNFKIVATDGLSLLKEKPYNNDGEPYAGFDTFGNHLGNILSKIGLANVAGNGLVTHLYWQADGQAEGNILDDTRVDYAAFYAIDNNGNKQYRNSYSVLKEFCTLLCARFFYWGGTYYLIQINAYEVLPIYDLNVNLQVRGGIWRFLPNLRKVQVQFKYGDTLHNQDGLLLNNDAPCTSVQGEYDFGNQFTIQATLEYTTKLHDDYFANNGFVEHRVLFGIKFAPQRYLKRKTFDNRFYYVTEQEQEWTEEESYYEIYGDVITETIGYNTHQVKINITTPPYTGIHIENTQLCVEVLDIIEPEGVITSIDIDWKLSGINVNGAEYEDLPSDQEKIYDAYNNIQGNSKQEVILTKIGENNIQRSAAKIEIFTGSEWVLSYKWKVIGEAESRPLGALLAAEYLAGQTTTVRILSHTLINENITPCSQIMYKGVNYILMGARWNFEKGQVTGEWFQVKVERGNVSTATVITGDGSTPLDPANPRSNEEVEGNNNTSPVGGNLAPTNENTTQIINNNVQNILDYLSIFRLDQTIEKDSTYTELQVSPLPYSIQKGNPVRLIHPVTGDLFDFTVEVKPDGSPYEIGATTIYIEEMNSTQKFPFGSYFITSVQAPTERKIQRFTNQQTDSLEVNFDLPDSLIDETLTVLRAGRQVFHGWDFDIETNEAGERKVIKWRLKLFGENVVIKIN